MKKLKYLVQSKFRVDMIWSLGSVAALAIGGVLVNIIIIYFRDEEALGIYNQVSAIYLILSQIIVFGFHQSVLKVFSYNSENSQICYTSLIAGLILVTITSIPIILVGIFFSNWISNLLQSSAIYQGLLLALPGLWFFSMNKILLNSLNGLRKMKPFAIFRSLRYILITIIICTIIFLGYSNEWLPLSLSLSELILFFILFTYSFTKIFKFSRPENLYEHIKVHFSFGVRGMLSGVLLGFNSRIDIIILGYFLSDSQVGIYSFASLLASGFNEIINITRINIDPILGKYFAKNEINEIENFSKKMKKQFFPLVAVSGFSLILVYPFFSYFFIEKQSLGISWIIFTLIMIGIISYSGIGIMKGIILQGNKPGLYTIYTLVLVIGSVMLNFLIIPIFGLIGASIVAMSTYIFSAIYLIIICKKVFKIKL